MIKKIILPFFIILSLFIGYPSSIFAVTTSPIKSPTKTIVTASKTTTKKVVVKKKKKVVAKKKEKLIAIPPLFTLDTAPHSAKPVYRSTKKKTSTPVKKPVVVKKKV